MLLVMFAELFSKGPKEEICGTSVRFTMASSE